MRTRIERLWPLLALAVIVAIVLLSFPYLASAYYLEAGGRAMDDPEQALHLLNKALDWDGGNAQAYRLLAKIERAQGDLHAAASALEFYVQLRPNNPLGHIELAEAYEAIAPGSDPAVVQQWIVQITEEWRQAGYSAEDLVGFGQEAQKAGRIAEAHNWYERAIMLNADWEKPYQLLRGTFKGDRLALQHLHLGDKVSLQKAEWLRPGDLYVGYLFWKQANEAGDLDRAETYRRSLDYFPLEAISPADNQLLAFVAEVIPELLERNLWDAQRAWNVVWFLVHQNSELTGVETLLEDLIERYPTESGWYFCLAELYRLQGDFGRAESLYQQVLSMNPEMAIVYLQLGKLATESSTFRSEDAAKWYERYQEVMPEDLLGLKLLVDACAALEQVKTDSKACEKAARRVAEQETEPEKASSPAELLRAGWLERLATAQPQYAVNQHLDNGWMLLGYDVYEERLVREEPVDMLLYWEGPSEVHAGDAQKGWYRAGERWIHLAEGVKNLLPNGGFELGTAGFPDDIYEADSGTRQLTRDVRLEKATTVAVLVNTEEYTRTSFVSVDVAVRPDTLYLQSGWIRSEEGNAFLGRRWAGNIENRQVPHYSYVVGGANPNEWQQFAQLVSPLPGAEWCEVWLLNWETTGKVYFDNVYLVELQPPDGRTVSVQPSHE